jgi:hypothetical protein
MSSPLLAMNEPVMVVMAAEAAGVADNVPDILLE